jgi:hypothetical protein
MPETENARVVHHARNRECEGDALCLKIEKEGAMHYAQKLRRRG